MELSHLQTFVVVAEENSITQAAKRLFTTTSSISVQIKTLEDELGVQLFVRTARGMQITEKGEALLVKARHTLQSVRDLVNHATEMRAHLMGKVSLGLNATLSFLRIPELIQTLHTEAPGINLHFQQRCSRRVIEDVVKGKLDLGFVFGAINDNRLTVMPLRQAELRVVAPPDWHLQAADWTELGDHPWICNDYDCPFQDIIDQAFAQRGIPYKSLVTTDDETSKAELVARGFGLSLLEAGEAQTYARIGRLALVQSITFPCELALVCLTYRRVDPLIETVLDIIERVWRSPCEAASTPEVE
jgi:DNA-binding transcriptional LysR family regulator